jgi:hypothetical protein
MAGSFSNTLETKILDHVFGGPDYTRPATLYVALFTAAPGEAGGGTECTGGSYARAAVTNNATNFPAASGTPTEKVNATEIKFAPLSASIGTVVGVALFDALTSGTMICYSDIEVSKQKSFGADDVPVFPPGAIKVTLD